MLPLFSARTRRISKINSCLRIPVAPALSRSLAIFVSAVMLISFIADSDIAWAGALCGWPPGCGGLPEPSPAPPDAPRSPDWGGFAPPLPAPPPRSGCLPPWSLFALCSGLPLGSGLPAGLSAVASAVALGAEAGLFSAATLSGLPAGLSAVALGAEAGVSAEAGGAAVATPPLPLAGLRSSSTVHPVLRPCALKPAARGYQITFRIDEHGAPARRAPACPLRFRLPRAATAATPATATRPCPTRAPGGASPRGESPRDAPGGKRTTPPAD